MPGGPEGRRCSLPTQMLSASSLAASDLPLLVRLAIELSPLFRETLPYSERCDFTFWSQEDDYFIST